MTVPRTGPGAAPGPETPHAGDPTVSVVVCAYTADRLPVLGEAVEAVRAQLRAGDELVLVADHNEDLAARCREAWPGLRVIPNGHAPGLSGGRNTGAEATAGDVVAFLDDDAVPRPGWLDALRDRFRDPRVTVVGGAVLPRWEGGAPPRWFPVEFGWVVGCDYRGLPPDGGRIRNPIGASMAVRRTALEAAGPFAEGLGRVGELPVGCEETELGIRLSRAVPDGHGVRDTRARVDHLVPASRGTLRYFVRRCWHEGRSKAALSALVGTEDGLSSERGYVARVLPAGVVRAVRGAAAGRPAELGRAAAIVLGLGATGLGYLAMTLRRSARGSAALVPDAAAGARLDPGPAATGSPLGPAGAEGTGHGTATTPGPTAVTVVVCTLGRDPRLAGTVESLLAQDHEDVRVVVVDNDPAGGGVRRLVGDLAGRRPERVRIVEEPRRGLSVARNTGLRATTTPLVAYTDDDAVADPGWISALVAVFAADPLHEVGCVTGLVEPAELATAEQVWFEEFGGFGKGDDVLVWHARPVSPAVSGLGSPGPRGAVFPYSAGEFGSGNNMAFRTDLLRRVGGFDVALGAGALTRGGEDLDAFRTVYLAGAAIVYTPHAVVRHHHRADYDSLRTQMFGYGSGMAASMTKLLVTRPGHGLRVVARVPQAARLLLDPGSTKNEGKSASFPAELTRTELRGYAAGPWLYLRARAGARRLRSPLGPGRAGP